MLKYYFFLFFLLLKLSFFTYSQTWNTLDNGVYNLVNTLCEYQNELYVGGNFTSAGTLSANYIARWNGTSWSQLDTGQAQLSGEVYSLAVYNNELYVSGIFIYVQGVDYTRGIAKWNGSSWSAVMANNLITGYIYCMAVYNNELYVGGNITKINNISVHRMAKWDGSQWADVGGGVTGGFGEIKTMEVYNNELYVGGDFTKAGNTSALNIARWNGSLWDSCGSGLQGYVNSMVVDTVKNIFYVGGTLYNAGGIPVNIVAQWDGNNWSATGWGITTGGLDMTMYNNNLYVSCQNNNTIQDTAIAFWDGIEWKPLLGPNCDVGSLLVYKDKLYVGGCFTYVNSLQANRIVSYDEQVNVIEIDKESNNYIKEIIPNPTNEFTVISYILPPNAVNSVIQIFDSAGKSVAIYSLSKAMSSIKIEVKDFPQGIYSLSLVTDSNVIDTRKMVVVK